MQFLIPDMEFFTVQMQHMHTAATFKYFLYFCALGLLLLLLLLLVVILFLKKKITAVSVLL